MSIIYLRKIPAYLLLLMFLLPDASAQEMSAVPATLTIPDGTPIKLQLAENVSSTHARVGDSLDFVVVRDVNVGGFTVIPAGTMARGSVTGVKGRRFLGIGGSVTLKLDSVELVNGDRVGLRADMRVKGRSRTRLMALGMIATGLFFLPAAPVFLLTRGHASTALKSTEITAQIDGATSIPSAELLHSREGSSELSAMMDYLPPRVFNGEGREGDMVNLVFVAQQKDLQDAFERAGWVQTDKWNPIFVWHLLRAPDQRRAVADGQVLSVRKSAGLLVCLARSGRGHVPASSSSNLEDRVRDARNVHLGGCRYARRCT